MNLISEIELTLNSPPRCGTTHLIAIDGRAGAGKTALAHELFLGFSGPRDVTVIALDDVYSGWDSALGPKLTQTLTDLLESISAEKEFLLPIFNWQSSSFDSHRVISPSNLIIIEGVGSCQKIVREFSSATIWLDIEAEIGLQRVLERDGNDISQEMKQWQIAEEKLFTQDETRKNADFVLSTIA